MVELKDVDRALGVHKIYLAGVSLRSLAKELNCSPTQMRKLNLAAQASTLDLLMSRHGRLSTKELARRGKAKKELQANKKRKGAMEQVSQAICEWLQREGHSGGQGEQIVNEARSLLASHEANNQLPRVSLPQPGTPIEQIIERTKPPWPVDDRRIPWIHRADSWHWYAQWLVRWVYFALPNSNSRHQALESALELQYRVM